MPLSSRFTVNFPIFPFYFSAATRSESEHAAQGMRSQVRFIDLARQEKYDLQCESFLGGGEILCVCVFPYTENVLIKLSMRMDGPTMANRCSRLASPARVFVITFSQYTKHGGRKSCNMARTIIELMNVFFCILIGVRYFVRRLRIILTKNRYQRHNYRSDSAGCAIIEHELITLPSGFSFFPVWIFRCRCCGCCCCFYWNGIYITEVCKTHINCT